MNLDHLPGQPGSQVTGRAVHHADQRGDIVREFRPAAAPRRVHAAKIVFEADPRTHWNAGGQNPSQDRLLRVVLSRVIGDEERAPVEKQAASSLPSADDANGVGGVTPFRANLGQVFRSITHVFPGLVPSEGQRGRMKPPSAFMSVSA